MVSCTETKRNFSAVIVSTCALDISVSPLPEAWFHVDWSLIIWSAENRKVTAPENSAKSEQKLQNLG